MKSPNTFELEQKILSCWNITDEIDTIVQYMSEHDVDQQNLITMLSGLKSLYHLKFDDLFTTYTKVIHE